MDITVWFVGKSVEDAKTRFCFDSFESAESFCFDWGDSNIYKATAIVDNSSFEIEV